MVGKGREKLETFLTVLSADGFWVHSIDSKSVDLIAISSSSYSLNSIYEVMAEDLSQAIFLSHVP